MATHVRTEINDKVAVVSFYEEEERKPCTIDWNVLDELTSAFDDVEDSDPVVLILRSDSPKSFIVGANIAVLQTLDAESIQDWVREGHAVFDRLQTMTMPTIACVESLALGGGLEISLACDFIIATDNARFAQPEASLGVMPGWGGSLRLPQRIGMARAKEMFYTGAQISAGQAYEWGLVNHVCRPEELKDILAGIVGNIKGNDARVLALTKEIVNAQGQGERIRNAADEAITSAVCMGSESTKKRLSDFFDSRHKK